MPSSCEVVGSIIAATRSFIHKIPTNLGFKLNLVWPQISLLAEPSRDALIKIWRRKKVRHSFFNGCHHPGGSFINWAHVTSLTCKANEQSISLLMFGKNRRAILTLNDQNVYQLTSCSSRVNHQNELKEIFSNRHIFLFLVLCTQLSRNVGSRDNNKWALSLS